MALPLTKTQAQTGAKLNIINGSPWAGYQEGPIYCPTLLWASVFLIHGRNRKHCLEQARLEVLETQHPAC